MPSKVLTTRVPPDTYARLQALAKESGRSLAATTADLLDAAVAGVPSPTQDDGPLTASVRAGLVDVTAPDAVMHREVALALARTVDRRECGHVAALRELPGAVSRSRRAQDAVDNPGPQTMSELLSLMEAGLM
ncbi:hypothetical protein ACWEBX_03290 [Streptomyces sp. NPDC005070]